MSLLSFLCQYFFWTSHWEHWWIKTYKWACSISEIHHMLMHYRKLLHKVVWASVFEKFFQLIPLLFYMSYYFLFFCPNFLLKKYYGNTLRHVSSCFVIRKFYFMQVCPVQWPFSCFCSCFSEKLSILLSVFLIFFYSFIKHLVNI